LYSSPLQRALFTARAISRNIGLDPIVEAGLAEMNFGAVEGHNIDQLGATWPDLLKQIRESRDADVQFPEGESRSQFHYRVRTTLDAIATAAQGQRIVVVAHGGVISSAVAQILGDDPGQWQKYAVDNCSITHIELSTTKPVAHMINDVVHLDVLNAERAELPNTP
ncbi:MAG: histidine phosphatase family protein, partial [Thermomicrobiales bacterium]|nr:histidine phosphatase family protein [Thermomicrobiales bacterium]